MPEFFRSTAKKPGATKVRKGYKSGEETGFKVLLKDLEHLQKKLKLLTCLLVLMQIKF